MYHTEFCAITSCISCTIVLCVVSQTKRVMFDIYYSKEVCTLKIVLRIHSEKQGITLIK